MTSVGLAHACPNYAKGEVGLGRERREKGWKRKLGQLIVPVLVIMVQLLCEVGLKNVTCTILTVGDVL